MSVCRMSGSPVFRKRMSLMPTPPFWGRRARGAAPAPSVRRRWRAGSRAVHRAPPIRDLRRAVLADTRGARVFLGVAPGRVATVAPAIFFGGAPGRERAPFVAQHDALEQTGNLRPRRVAARLAIRLRNRVDVVPQFAVDDGRMLRRAPPVLAPQILAPQLAKVVGLLRSLQIWPLLIGLPSRVLPSCVVQAFDVTPSGFSSLTCAVPESSSTKRRKMRRISLASRSLGVNRRLSTS